METEAQAITNFLTEKISAYSKVPVSELPAGKALEDIGLSSLDIVMISGEIEDEFDIEIDPSVIFDSRTINEVVEKVLKSKD